MAEFSILLGKTLLSVVKSPDNDVLIFTCSDGSKYKQCHLQDCCENVEIKDICGDLSDLLMSPILQAEESSSPKEIPHGSYGDGGTWTFYKLATIKGSVTISWLGESNGYYSESVNFEELKSSAA